MKYAIAICLAITLPFLALSQGNAGNLSEEDREKLQDGLAPQESEKDTLWDLGGTLGFNVTQSYFENWAAGGQNSFSVTALTSLFAKYKKDRHSWETTLDLAYGQLSQSTNRPIKTDDRIDLTSKYGYKTGNKNFYYSALFNLRTQFRPGFKIEDGREVGAKISDFLAPAFSIFSLGIDYKPNKKFSALVSPLTLKTTVVSVDRLATEYGLDAGDNVRFEPGAFVKVAFQDDIFENVNLLTKIDLFSNYINNPENVDINWETLITLKVNSWLSTTITTQLIYDDDIIIGQQDPVIGEGGEVIEPGTSGGPRTQFREVLAIGLTLKI
ncbi:MAG: DUF3078 domain-containing protein [Flavobacteriales bacterium]|nr:DUF3078 domain-containing protein [Flavobacteriales bacterium]